MTHYGLICPAASSHLSAITTLGYELKKRGDRVTLIGILDAQPKALAAGLEFRAIGESDFPQGTMKDRLIQLGKMSGLAALKYTISTLKTTTIVHLREVPQVIKDAGIDGLIVDQVSPEGGSIAELLGIPFVSCACAIILNREINVPPFNTSWSYSPAIWAKLRNWAGLKLLTKVGQPIRDIINEYRREWNLQPYTKYNDFFSQLAQISQQPIEFEFPRQELPPYLHFTGPYSNPAVRETVSFPFEKLTGQPLIYASMGTIQNRLLDIFKYIAEACQEFDAQLVISLGGSASPEVLQGLPGNPIVVGYAPQLELLEKATLTITHAGMNTTLESLSHGVPMVAIPITNDQPGVAARIAWSGCGEAIVLKKLNVSRLRTAIEKVLTEDSYKNNALRLQQAIQKAGGVTRAADIVEQAISTGKPVLSHN